MTSRKHKSAYKNTESKHADSIVSNGLTKARFSGCSIDVIVVSLLQELADKTRLDIADMRYLEIGTNHSIPNSATYMLHVGLKMRGLLVESNPAGIPDLIRQRPGDRVLNATLANSETEFANVSSHSQGADVPNESELRCPTIKERPQKIPARQINSILEEFFPFQAPAFLSLDAAGQGVEVLSDLSFSRWRPLIIQSVSSYPLEQDTTKTISDLLQKKGYEIIVSSETNILVVDAKQYAAPAVRSIRPREWLTSADVDPKISSFDFLSIDIFDTLLFRHCRSPIDAFGFMQQHKHVTEVTEFFVDFRVAAERLAREDGAAKGEEDVSLDEIYGCFKELTNCTTEQAEAIKAVELQTELDILSPTTFGQNLINHVRQAGKRFIITSDMYLPQSFLEDLLRAKGITGYERVLVSNEQGRTKHMGSLFQDVIDHFEVESDKILHIGDNKFADGKMAAAAGLQTYVVPASKDLPARSPKPKRHSHLLAGQMPISQVFIANYLETHHYDARTLDFRKLSDDEYFEAFGAVILAPIITSLMIWMKRHMDRRGIERIVFLARDGYFPKAVFELLWPAGIETSYIAASRRLLTLPFTLLDPDTIHGMFDSTLKGSATLNEFLSKIAAGAQLIALYDESSIKLSDTLNRKKRRAVMKVLKDNPKVVYESFAEERTTLTKYYRKAFPANSRSAIFDVGWRGSLQRSINQITEDNARISGFYFGTSSTAANILRRQGADYECYTSENGLPKHKLPWAEDFRDIVEFLCSADHGSVMRVTENADGEMIWEMSDVSTLERASLDLAAKVQKGAFAAIESVLKTLPVEVLEKYTSRDDERDVRNFLAKPHREDARRFKNVRIFAGVGDTSGESLTRIGDKKSHYYNAKNSRWRAAYAASLNGFTRAWLRLLLRKRKKIRL